MWYNLDYVSVNRNSLVDECAAAEDPLKKVMFTISKGVYLKLS